VKQEILMLETDGRNNIKCEANNTQAKH